jgi:hypothetical protein
VQGKLGIWRTPGPDGRALTTINMNAGLKPIEGTRGFTLYFGKKGEDAADKLYDEASKLYGQDRDKNEVVVTGNLREVMYNGKAVTVLQVTSITAAEKK